MEERGRGIFQAFLCNLPTGSDENYRKPLSEFPVPRVLSTLLWRAVMRLGSEGRVSQWEQILKALVA
jgi:hypothetical protein